LRHLERQLRVRLDRISCPDPQEIGEFHLGRLATPRAKAVREHISTCPHCAQELSQLQAFLGALPPGAEVPPQTHRRTIIARLLDLGRQGLSSLPAPAPAWATARGPASTARVYQAEDLQVAIESQAGTLTGLVLAPEPGNWTVHAWEGDRHAGQAAVDQIGNFTMSGLQSSTYDLVLVGPEAQVHIPSLKI
jgi:anti-sigma factor RsiW